MLIKMITVLLFIPCIAFADVVKNYSKEALPELFGVSISAGKDETGLFTALEVSVNENKSQCLQLREITLFREDNLKVIASSDVNSELKNSTRKMKFYYSLDKYELINSKLILFFKYNDKVNISEEQKKWCRARVNTEILFPLPQL